MLCLVTQLCLTPFCDPMYYSPPGPSVHGFLQARILEWVAMASSRGSSQHRDQTQVSCIAGRFFYHPRHQGSLCKCICIYMYIYMYRFTYMCVCTYGLPWWFNW